MQTLGKFKEGFCHYREKFSRAFGGIGIDGGVMPVLQLLIEIVIGRGEGLGPGRARHLGVQRRHAVGGTVQHIQLVCEFMEEGQKNALG